MKKLLLFVLATSVLTLPALAQDFYDVNTVHTIEITFAQSNWDRNLDSLYAIGEERLLGSLAIDGVLYDSVGIRYKGFSTYNPNRTKKNVNTFSPAAIVASKSDTPKLGYSPSAAMVASKSEPQIGLFTL